MIEIEVIGRRRFAPDGPGPAEIRRLCTLAAASAGGCDGHLAVHFVDERRMAELNGAHRAKPSPTDVLAFPIDGAGQPPGMPPGSRRAGPSDASGTPEASGPGVPPCELGDVVICPPRAHDLREVLVHGVLHLVGMDHERDHGEMLALQAKLLEGLAL
ncbi:MAG: rRNA maturation RNase YbeY [Solirubrobacteraceae bacterium]